MTYLLIYDISDNRLRRQVEIACRDAGLSRVQKSAFRGELSPELKEKLLQRLAELTYGDESSDIQLYPMPSGKAEKVVHFLNGRLQDLAPDRPEAVLIL